MTVLRRAGCGVRLPRTSTDLVNLCLQRSFDVPRYRARWGPAQPKMLCQPRKAVVRLVWAFELETS